MAAPPAHRAGKSQTPPFSSPLHKTTAFSIRRPAVPRTIAVPMYTHKCMVEERFRGWNSFAPLIIFPGNSRRKLCGQPGTIAPRRSPHTVCAMFISNPCQPENQSSRNFPSFLHKVPALKFLFVASTSAHPRSKVLFGADPFKGFFLPETSTA